MIIKYLFYAIKKKFEQEQSFAGVDEDSAGFDEDSAGLGQGSANYLGSNRILRGSWPHGPPPLAELKHIVKLVLKM